MSISRSREERGFSAGAAFILAVILAGVGIGIQSTIPVTSSPKTFGEPVDAYSQTAAAVEGSLAVNTVKVDQQQWKDVTQLQSKTESKTQCNPGYDYLVFDTGNSLPEAKQYEVCPLPPHMIDALRTSGPFLGTTWGLSNDRCAQNPKFDNHYTPKEPEKNWKCDVIWCAPPGIQVSGATKSLKPNPDFDQGSGIASDAVAKDFKNGKVQCYIVSKADTGAHLGGADMRAQGLAQMLPGLDDKERNEILGKFGDLSDQDQSIMDDAYKVELQQKVDQTKNQIENIDKKIDEIQKLGTGNCEITDSKCQEGNKVHLDELKAQKKDLESQQSKFQDELNALAKDKSILQPPRDDVRDINGGDPYSKVVGVPRGGDTFMGNTIESPLGGPCTTGYVCRGNTLYYQSSGPQYVSYSQIVVQERCTAQPVQQCQYGCQQQGGFAQGGSSGGGLSGFMKGLQIVSAFSGLLGGGGNNQMMGGPTSNSCALSPQQQQSPNGTGNNGQACPRISPQPDPSLCSAGGWRPAAQNGCQTGWQCVPDGSTSGQPTAQLSCQPKFADAGMPISFSFSCGNASGSAGTGFDTHGALSGNATSTAPVPPPNQNIAMFALTCIKLGITASAQCQVELGKPGIVFVTNPKNVTGGDISLIGWITSGMKSCVVSSPDQADFTTRNAGITSVNGAATTSPILMTSRFQLDCETLGGDMRQATTTVTMQ